MWLPLTTYDQAAILLFPELKSCLGGRGEKTSAKPREDLVISPIYGDRKMALTDGDKAECKEIAREIVKEVMVEHIASCPHGKSLLASKMFLMGMSIGSGAAGGGIALALARVIMG